MIRQTQTRHAIETSGLRLFGERGYDAVTVEEVAGAAGVSPATVYRYYGTKEAIVFAPEPQLRELFLDRLRSAWSGTVSRQLLVDALADVAGVIDKEREDTLARNRLAQENQRLADGIVLLVHRWEDAACQTIDELAEGDPEPLRTRVTVAAALVAFSVALREWGTATKPPTLSSLVTEALGYLS